MGRVDRRRFLVVRLQHLGDLILTLPVIDALGEAFPDAAIDLLTREEYAPLLSRHPGITRIIPWPRGETTIGALRRVGKMVRQVGYTAVIDLQVNTKSHLLRPYLGTAAVHAAPKAALNRRWWVLTRRYPRKELEHVVDRYLQALAPLGIRAYPEEIRFPVTREAELEASSFLLGRRMEGIPLVGIVPGARQETKRWPVAHFRALAGMARAQGCGVVVAGGPGEEDLMREVTTGQGEGVVSWDPTLPLDTLAALLGRCHVVVTNDNGLMHLASAVGTPVVALFGPTVPAFGFFPLGDRHRVLERELPCRPCSLHGRKPCKIPGRPCLTAITPGEAWKAAREAMGGGKGSGSGVRG